MEGEGQCPLRGPYTQLIEMRSVVVCAGGREQTGHIGGGGVSSRKKNGGRMINGGICVASTTSKKGLSALWNSVISTGRLLVLFERGIRCIELIGIELHVDSERSSVWMTGAISH